MRRRQKFAEIAAQQAKLSAESIVVALRDLEANPAPGLTVREIKEPQAPAPRRTRRKKAD